MLVLTQGRRLSPRRTALRANSPAPIITDGLEVLVQLVMAAITTDPSERTKRLPSYSTSAAAVTSDAAATAVAGDWPPSPDQRAPSRSPTARRAWGTRFGSTWRKEALTSLKGTRSWGRRGPASEGTTLPKSSSRVSE